MQLDGFIRPYAAKQGRRNYARYRRRGLVRWLYLRIRHHGRQKKMGFWYFRSSSKEAFNRDFA